MASDPATKPRPQGAWERHVGTVPGEEHTEVPAMLPKAGERRRKTAVRKRSMSSPGA